MKLRLISIFAVLTLGAAAHGQNAVLKIDSDLMIHPNQVADFFNIAASQISSSTVWNWPTLQFTKPYNTAWTNVNAHGPFDIAFDTSNLANQELGFTLNWTNPDITIGEFAIHDVVSNNVGGVIVNVHLDGTCTGMEVKIPQGQWAVAGKMHWDLSTGAFLVSWESFAFQMSQTAAPQVNLGQCQGQAGLLNALQTAVVQTATNQLAMQSVLNQGILDWVQGSLATLAMQLLSERDVQMANNVKLAWMPAALSSVTGGMMRVAGSFVLSKPGSTVGADYLPRNYALSTLNSVPESSFIMPVASMQHILNYMSTNGALLYRLSSLNVPAFQSLMNSSFMQFFVWPDLMNFPSTTQFYFDLTTASAPQLSSGYMLKKGGSAYTVNMPMLIHQWAPANGAYLPYIDFSTPVSGQLSAQIANGSLTFQMQSGDLNLKDVFRHEFAATRPENTWISNSILGSNLKSYLNSTPFSMPVPSWQLGNDLSLTVRDIQVWTQTFRIPLQFTQGAQP